MKGSEKQIKWAEDIKTNCIHSFEMTIERWEAQPAGAIKNSIKAYKLMLAITKYAFDHIDDAKTIIDRRTLFDASTLSRKADRWAEQLNRGETTITELAAKNGLKEYKED